MSAVPETYRLILFGPVQLFKSQDALEIKNGLPILAYLGSHPNMEFTQRELGERMYPQSEADAAYGRLRSNLKNLKRCLVNNDIPHEKIISQNKMALNTKYISCDYSEFHALLWQIKHLPDPQPDKIEQLMSRDVVAFLANINEPWADTLRTDLRKQTVAEFKRLAEHYAAEHNSQRAIELAKYALNLIPLDGNPQLLDNLYGLVLECMKNISHPYQWYNISEYCRDAVERHKRANTTFPKCLYFYHAEATKHLLSEVQAVCSPDTALPVRRPASYHAPTTPCFGREDKLNDISRFFAQPGVRVVTITGMGGIGKTCLAREWLHRANSDGQHHRYWVEADQCRTVEQLEAEIARVLLSQPPAKNSRNAKIHRALKGTPVLLVLDNMEQIAQAAQSWLSNLLHTNPDVKLLVTSRLPLALNDEQLVPVSSLSCGTPTDHLAFTGDVALSALDNTSFAPALSLLLYHLRRTQPDLTITPQWLRNAYDYCTRLDGIPLFIEVTAFNPDLHRLLATHTAANPVLLASSPQQYAASLWNWHVSKTDDALFRVLGELATFSGSFTIDAAQAVSTAPAINDSLLQLQRLQLIRLSSEFHGTRWEMIKTFRDAAANSLSLEERAALNARHAHYFAGLLAAIPPDSESDPLFTALLPDQYNLRAAYQWHREHADIDALIAFTLIWSKLLGRLSLFRESAEAITDTFKRTPPDHPRYIEVLRILGGSLQDIGEKKQSLQCKQQALELAQASGNLYELALCRLSLGHRFATLSRYSEAETLVLQALDYLQTQPLSKWLPYALHSLGGIYQAQSRLEQGADCFRRAVPLWVELKIHWRATYSRMNLGSCLAEQDINQPRKIYEQCLSEFTQQGDYFGIGVCWIIEGEYALFKGDTAAASRWYKRAAEMHRWVGSLSQEGIAYTGLGNAALAEANFSHAETYFRKALSLLREVGERKRIIECFEGISALKLAQGDGVEALRLMAHCIAARQELNAPLSPRLQLKFDRFENDARCACGDAAFEEALSRPGSSSPEDFLFHYPF